MQGELTVALRASQRAAARSPGNPLQAALLNTPAGPLPQWGYGHNVLNSSQGMGASVSAHRARPASAGAMLMGGGQGGASSLRGSLAAPFGSAMSMAGLMQTGAGLHVMCRVHA